MTSWTQFRAIPNGTRIFNNGYDQCVALANHFHQAVLEAPFVPVGSAFQWWTDYDRLPQVNKYYRKSATPVPGALFVARGGIYDQPNGHIGVVTDVRAGGFSTLEQNTGPYAPQRYVYRHFRIRDDNVLGFLIPIDNPAEEDIVTPKDKAEIADLVVEKLMNYQVPQQGSKKGKGKYTSLFNMVGWSDHHLARIKRETEKMPALVALVVKLAAKLGVK